MKSKVTPRFSKKIADDIKQDFALGNVFLGIGRSMDFGSSPSNLEPVIFSVNKNNQLFRNLVGVKRLAAADMQVVIARSDWNSDAIYDAFTDDIDLFTFEDFSTIGVVNANSDTIIPGTVSVPSTVGTPTVIGSGTEFTKYLFVGDQISVNSEIKTVLMVQNNTSIITNSNFTNVHANGNLTLLANNTLIVSNVVNFVGNVFVGNTIVVNEEIKEVVAVRSDKVLSVNSNLTISVANTTLLKQDNTYPLYANNFYVRNSRDQVFKCLYNNERANSTVEPTIDIDGQLPESPFILTSDGYKWKYLYTIAPGLKQKFFTDVWMPVANDNAVIAATAENRIDIINVLWGGSGHLGGGNSNTARILSITNTDGSGANLACRVANGEITSVTILTGGSNYTRGIVTVSDDDKLGNVTLSGTVNISGTSVIGSNFVGNVFINDIITVNNESRNVVSVVDNTNLTVNTAFIYPTNNIVAGVQRSNAIFDIEFSPPGGHGFFPARELAARSLMICTELNGDEQETIPVSDSINTFDFNQVSIISEPLVANGAFAASGSNYRTSTRILVSDPGLSDYLNDETVYIGLTVENASMVANVVHWDSTNKYLYINNITGPVIQSELIRGENSGTVAIVLEVANSEIKLFSGEILYIDNRVNLVRSVNQVEQIKTVLTF